MLDSTTHGYTVQLRMRRTMVGTKDDRSAVHQFVAANEPYRIAFGSAFLGPVG